MVLVAAGTDSPSQAETVSLDREPSAPLPQMPTRTVAPSVGPTAVVVPTLPKTGCHQALATIQRSRRASIARPEGKRTYELRLPRAYDGKRAAPLVFLFHPWGSTAADMLKLTELDTTASARGFVTVALDGVHGSYNGGDCCGDAARTKIDDVATVNAILDEVEASYCIDDHRVHATGFSNGGFLSFSLACSASNRIASIATAGAVTGVRDCAPTRPVSVLMINGVGDDVIPPKGGGPMHTEPLLTTVDGWVARNACERTPKITKVNGTTCTRYSSCGEEGVVESCIVPYAHVWMGRREYPHDSPSRQRVAGEILDFFEQHPVPTSAIGPEIVRRD